MTARLDACEQPNGFARFARTYGFAHFGKSLFWHGSELLFAFYLTEICGLAARWMAAVLTVSMLAGAIADIGVGALLGRRVTGMGSAIAMQRLGAVASSGALVLFAAIALLDEHWRLPAAAITLLLFRLGYAWFDVPQNALMTFAAHDDPSRARLSSVRYVGSGLAAIIVALLFALLLEDRNRTDQAVHFALLGFVWTAIALVGAFALTASPATTPPHPVPTPKYSRFPARSALGGLLLAMFAFTLWSSLFNKLQAYLQAPTGTEGKAAGAILIGTALGTMVGQPIWAELARRRSIEASLGWSSAALAFAGLAFVPLTWLGWGGIGLAGLFYGIAWGGVAMALWALLARIGAGEPDVGVTMTMGLFTFSAKLGGSAAVLLLGEVLARLDGYSLPALMAALPLSAAICVALATQLGCQRRASSIA